MNHNSRISSINQPSPDNIGGYKAIYYRPTSEVMNIPIPDLSYNITHDVALPNNIDGFHQLYTTFKTTNVDISEELKPQGPVIEVEIRGIVPGDSNINQAVFQFMQYERFIVIGEDNAGIQRLFGTLDNGMRFRWEYNSQEEPEGRRGYEIIFSGKFSFAPYYYQSHVPVHEPNDQPVEVIDGNKTILLNDGETYTCSDNSIDADFTVSTVSIRAFHKIILEYVGETVNDQIFQWKLPHEAIIHESIYNQLESPHAEIFFETHGDHAIGVMTTNGNRSGAKFANSVLTVLPPFNTGDLYVWLNPYYKPGLTLRSTDKNNDGYYETEYLEKISDRLGTTDPDGNVIEFSQIGSLLQPEFANEFYYRNMISCRLGSYLSGINDDTGAANFDIGYFSNLHQWSFTFCIIGRFNDISSASEEVLFETKDFRNNGPGVGVGLYRSGDNLIFRLEGNTSITTGTLGGVFPGSGQIDNIKFLVEVDYDQWELRLFHQALFDTVSQTVSLTSISLSSNAANKHPELLKDLGADVGDVIIYGGFSSAKRNQIETYLNRAWQYLN